MSAGTYLRRRKAMMGHVFRVKRPDELSVRVAHDIAAALAPIWEQLHTTSPSEWDRALMFEIFQDGLMRYLNDIWYDDLISQLPLVDDEAHEQT
jgi:hypothetical protein